MNDQIVTGTNRGGNLRRTVLTAAVVMALTSVAQMSPARAMSPGSSGIDPEGGFTPQAVAATYTVTNLNDSGAGSLRQAVIDATGNGVADTIVFDPALFSGGAQTLTLTSGELDVAGVGDNDAFTIVGPGASLLTISGNGASRVFAAVHDHDDHSYYGGNASALTLSSMTLTNGSFAYGSATYDGYGGGAVDAEYSGNLSLDHVVISGSSVSGNYASGGGGVYFIDPASSVSISNSTIDSNQVTPDSASYGGGLCLNGADITIINSTISGNASPRQGGGAMLYTKGSLAVINATFSGNNSGSGANTLGGGGGANISGPGADMTIVNSTFVDNGFIGQSGNATTGGGALRVFNATVTLSNNLIAGNSSTNSGNAAVLLAASGVANGSNNIISGSLGTYSASSLNNLTGTVTSVTGLGTLANNGGPVDTVAITATSNAVDAGTSTGAPVDDARGYARDASVDIGAYEYGATPPPAPVIASATYNAATGVLTVTGADMTTGDTIAVDKLSIAGEGGDSHTLTSPDVTASSATSFSVSLNAADQAVIALFLNKNGTSSTGGNTYNLAGAPDWDATSGAGADTSGNVITVSNVAVPTISSATYNAATGALVVTGTGFLSLGGAQNDIVANKLTFTGEGGSTYTLTDTANVEIASATSFTLNLSASDRAGVNQVINKNGTSSTGGTTYNLSAAEDWAAGADAAVVVADTTGNGITASNVAVPAITSATYDASTGTMVVTGTGFLSLSGASNDIVANKLTFTGEGGSTYTLTDTANVEIASATSFTLNLSASDRAGVNQVINKNGTSSTGGTTYNLAAAEDWAAGADAAVVVADTTGNGITASNVAVPAITSATYDASTGTMVVTGTGFLSLSGASNDIVAGKFTFTGEGGSTYTLTDTANVEIASATSFTLNLSASDRAGVNQVINKNGTSSTGGTTYNLSAAEDWAAGADAAVVVADTTGNGITASDVAVPAITSATYDASTGTIVVTGTGFLSLAGANNDIVANKFTFTGEGGATYPLTDTANVDIASGTSFILNLSAGDKAGVNQIINKNGTISTGGTTYNLAAREDWAAGADAAVVVADTTGNGIVASHVDASAVVTTSGGTTAFVEGSPVVVDSGVTVTDVDNTTLPSAIVAVSGGFHGGEDVLAFTSDGATMGDIIGSYSAGTGVLTLNSPSGMATLAQWQAALRAVTYDNTSQNPNTAVRTVSFMLDDGTRFGLPATQSVSVTGVNDPPTLTTIPNPAPHFTEGGSPVTLFTGTAIGTVEAGQNIHAVTLTVGGLADGAAEILGVDGTGVALTNGSNITTAASGYTVFVTMSGATATVTVTKAGDYSTTAAQTLVNGLTYSNTSDKPTVASGRTITLTSIQDTGGTANGGQDTAAPGIGEIVILNAVNDAPVVTTDSGSAAFVAGDNMASTPVAVDSGLTVSDVDNTSLASATVQISGNFHAGEDMLAFANDGATMGDVAASYDASTGVMTLTSAGMTTLAQWQSALASVTYTDTAITPDPATRTVSFIVNDGAADSAVATRTVTVTATDQTPIVTTTGGTTDYVVGTAAVTIDGGITVSDLDNATQSLATVSVTTGFHSGDTLGFANTSGALFGNITASYNAAIGMMTLTSAGASATNAHWANALSAVTFSSTSTSYGARTIAFATNDGEKTSAVATDTVNVLGLPKVTDVGSTTPDGSYKVGDTIQLTVTFDQAVIVDDASGTPTLLMETGGVDHDATYVSGSGSNTLTFAYAVQAGDASPDLDYASTAALALNGGTIRSGAGVDAVLTLPAAGGANSIAGQHAIVVDGVAPTVVSVDVPANGVYVAGQQLDFVVNYSEAVTVDTSGGTPRIAITLDTGGTVYADYLSGSGSTALVFRYTVASGQNDADGIVLVGSIDANGGVLHDGVGNAGDATLNGIASTSGVLVDAVAPTVSAVTVPADGNHVTGDALDFGVQFSEPVDVDTSGGTPRLQLTIGFATVYADYVSGSGTSTLQFTYTVLATNYDSNGIGIAGNLDLNGSTLHDAVGNDASTALGALPSTAKVLVNELPAYVAVPAGGALSWLLAALSLLGAGLLRLSPRRKRHTG